MRLSLIRVKPEVYQKRDTPYAEQTVLAICAEGIVVSKFDPLPLLDAGDGTCIVGGDGHSRYEALTRLAAENRLPADWLVANPAWTPQVDYDIPHKLVTPDEARELSWTGNLKGTSFSPVEEAKVFREMLDAGIPIDRVGQMANGKSAVYIRKQLKLLVLCHDIRVMVGRDPGAGGVEKFIAQTMADRFERYRIGHAQQQELWHEVFKHAELTKTFVEKFLDKFGRDLEAKRRAKGGGADFLFKIPPQAGQIVSAMRGRAENQRRIQRGLAWLLQAQREAPAMLEELPELAAVLKRHGEAYLKAVNDQAEVDATLVGALAVAG